MLNVGAGEMVVILVVALLVLGPKRLPEMARVIGKFLREFRRQTDDVRTLVEREFYRMDDEVIRPLEDPHPEKKMILPPDGAPDPAHDNPDHHGANAIDPSVASTDNNLDPLRPGEVAANQQAEVVPVPTPPPTAVSRERAKELASAAVVAEEPAQKKAEG